MGRSVDKRNELPVGELLLLLKSGYSVSHEGGGAIRLFTPAMKRYAVISGWTLCNGGRFVVRETTKSA